MAQANWQVFSVNCNDGECRGSRFGHVCADPTGALQEGCCWKCRERVAGIKSARASKAVVS